MSSRLDEIVVLSDKLRRIRALIRAWNSGYESKDSTVLHAIANVVEESVPAAKCVTCLIHGYWDKCQDPHHAADAEVKP